MFKLSHQKPFRRRLYMRLLIPGTLAVIIGISGCGGPPQEKPKPSVTEKVVVKPPIKKKTEPQTGSAVLKAAGITWSDEKGHPLLIAKYSVGTYERTNSDLFAKLHDVKADLYRDGKISAKMTAPLVEANARTKEVKASGGVKVVSVVEGGVATSQTMLWKPKENKIYGTGNVKMTRDGMTLTGNSFVSDTGLTGSASFR